MASWRHIRLGHRLGLMALACWGVVNGAEPVPAAPSDVQMDLLRASHWAFQPVTRPELPVGAAAEESANPIDRFVKSRLGAAGLELSPPAAPETRVRRVYFDVLGLPPSEQEVREFDGAPDAWVRLVDQLLARPQYGERWGRLWLDVARYADTKGYVDGGEVRYPFAYTYRDYVMQAFNEDLPYNRFVMEQLAADQLDRRGSSLAALGFLTVGHRFNLFPHEILDDRIDVVSRGFMGLTVACARCHDHKYDPISMADYYGWYGIFESSREPTPDQWPVQGPAQAEEEPKIDASARELHSLQQTLHQRIQHEMRAWAKDYLVYLVQTMEEHRTQAQPPLRTERGLLREVTAYGQGGVVRWREFIERRGSDDPVFGLWNTFAALSRAEVTSRGVTLARELAAAGQMNGLLAEAVLNTPPVSLLDVAELCGRLLEETEALWQETLKNEPAASGFDEAAREELRLVLYGVGAPPLVSLDESEDLYQLNEHVDVRSKYAALERVLLDTRAQSRAMVVVDREELHDPRIFLRGAASRPGPTVQRRFLRMFPEVNDQPFQHGSGRLDLAHALVHPRNPLTSRVWVNRVWAWHFGEGLVRTPSDFGARSEAPTHPELLDYLARWFMDEGWSTKKLHRLILTSRTYQQSSVDRPAARERDPDNRLLWRMNRRRLDFESMRDSLLAVAGRLDTTVGGRPVELGFDDPENRRRTVYTKLDREHLPSLLRVFDFPSPDLTSPQRSRTTVPQQTLFLLNNRFMMAQGEALVERLDRSTPIEERVNALHRWVYGREASVRDIALAREFLSEQPAVADQPTAPVSSWQYGYGQVEGGRLVSFKPLPHFTGEAWQGGPSWPDPDLHYLRLTGTGGHAGIDEAHNLVRRWTAPVAGVVEIAGMLEHGQEGCGDGVQARVISSRNGELGRWSAYKSRATTSLNGVDVAIGETIDFVVDPQKNHSCDLFEWAPVVRLVSAAPSDVTVAKREWHAEQEFGAGPVRSLGPLSPWAQYAQVLLQSNEFQFVD